VSRRGCGLIGLVVLILFIVALAGGAIGRGMNLPNISILKVPSLEIESFFSGEPVFLTDGPFPITNTLIASWVTIVVATLFAFAATRKMKIIPGRLQGLVEMAMEGLINFIESVAGHKNGRRFLPVIATIFIFVMFNAYLALLPVYGPGIHVTVEKKITAGDAGTVVELLVHPIVEEKDEVIALIETADGTREEVKAPAVGEFEYSVSKDDSVSEGQAVAIMMGTTGTGTEVTAPVAGTVAKLTLHRRIEENEQPIAKIATEENGVITLNSPENKLGELEYDVAVGQAVSADDEIAVLTSKPPFLRSASTDINMTLAMALIAVLFIELMGLTGRGFKHYISEYINVGELFRGMKLFFKGKIVDGLMASVTGVINVIIGGLEFVSHMTRMISFAFRLFGNMTAGEILVLSATFLIPWIMAMPFYGLELLIGFIQALIFGGLTLVFASIAVGHGSEEH
jgi:F0F1-type ATP synthase membrane subunit a/biotin carboxyl carrier protein